MDGQLRSVTISADFYLGWRLTYVTDGGDRARNGVLAGGGGERVVNKWGALGG